MTQKATFDTKSHTAIFTLQSHSGLGRESRKFFDILLLLTGTPDTSQDDLREASITFYDHLTYNTFMAISSPKRYSAFAVIEETL